MRLEPRLIHIAETDSTNRFMRMVSDTERLGSGSIVLADFQTAGRGLSGNSWESEAGKNLLFSVLLYSADVPANRPFVISEMAALCVKQTLDKHLSHVSVKWPNDVYCSNKKIAGMLLENILFQEKISQSVIGIGINVNQTTFPGDAPNPVSMALATGVYFDRLALLNEFCRAFGEQSERLNGSHFDAIHSDYLHAIYRKDGYHKYQDKDGVFEACIRDIEPAGYLVLERANGVVSRYAFKEVSYS
jgi:BirA family biotin operon repressor/biotin-[acetyl-CoA-carboxylase] ligase